MGDILQFPNQNLLQMVADLVDLPEGAVPTHGVITLAFEDESGGAYVLATLGAGTTASLIGLLGMAQIDLHLQAQGF